MEWEREHKKLSRFIEDGKAALEEEEAKTEKLNANLKTISKISKDAARAESTKLQGKLASKQKEVEDVQAQHKEMVDALATMTKERDELRQSVASAERRRQADHERTQVQLSAVMRALHAARSASQNGELTRGLPTCRAVKNEEFTLTVTRVIADRPGGYYFSAAPTTNWENPVEQASLMSVLESRGDPSLLSVLDGHLDSVIERGAGSNSPNTASTRKRATSRASFASTSPDRERAGGSSGSLLGHSPEDTGSPLPGDEACAGAVTSAAARRSRVGHRKSLAKSVAAVTNRQLTLPGSPPGNGSPSSHRSSRHKRTPRKDGVLPKSPASTASSASSALKSHDIPRSPISPLSAGGRAQERVLGIGDGSNRTRQEEQLTTDSF